MGSNLLSIPVDRAEVPIFIDQTQAKARISTDGIAFPYC